MFAIKTTATLLLLGVGGLLGVQPPVPSTASAPAAAAVAPSPDADALRTALGEALAARVRGDLDDASARLALGPIALDRSSLRSIEVRAQGTVQAAGARPIPVEVTGVYDLVDGRLDSADYTARPAEADLSPVDRLVRDAIGRRIGARIAAEFAGQQAEFALLDVARVGDDGRHRTRLKGAGLTDFGGEGLAYTPFEAILDKHTGEVLELRYDLLQEPEAPQPLVGL